MSKEIQKLGYCFTCDENVPHRRKKAKGLKEVFCKLLRKLHLERWYCLQCRSFRHFLPFVGEAAVEYWTDAPSDPETPYYDDFSIPLIESGDQQPIYGTAHRTLLFESRRDMFQEDLADQLDDFNCEKKEGGSVLPVNDGNSIAGEFSSVVDACDVSFESRPSASDRAAEIIVAEPVGNFIKEQSLVVEATRLKRFSEKYRDGLVDKILSGDTQINWLIADGKYTKAELLSWIVDKARRQSID